MRYPLPSLIIKILVLTLYNSSLGFQFHSKHTYNFTDSDTPFILNPQLFCFFGFLGLSAFTQLSWYAKKSFFFSHELHRDNFAHFLLLLNYERQHSIRAERNIRSMLFLIVWLVRNEVYGRVLTLCATWIALLL